MAFGMNQFENLESEEAPEQAFSDPQSRSAPTRGWKDFASSRIKSTADANLNANLKRFNELNAIRINAQKQEAEQARMRNADLASAVSFTHANGGYLPKSLLPSFSESLGIPLAGANLDKDGNMFFYTMSPDGRQLQPIAMVDRTHQAAALQEAGLDPDLYKRLYGMEAEKLTPTQLESFGLRNPNAPIKTGGVTMSGAAADALLGRPRKRSTISVYSTSSGVSRTKAPDGEWQEDYVSDATKRERADEEAKRQALVNGAKRNANGNLSLEDRLALEDRKDKRQQAALDARKESEGNKHEITLKRIFSGRVKAAQDDLSRYEKDLRNAKRDTVTGKKPLYTEEEIAKKLEEREKKHMGSLRGEFGDIADEWLGGKNLSEENASQATEPKEDNNGGETQYNSGDEQVINGKKYRLAPSKKDPNKLTWQPV